MRPSFEKNNASRCRINVPEIASQCKARQFSDRSGKFYSCGPTADESWKGDVVSQPFTGGEVSWNAKTKAFTTTPADLAGQLTGVDVPTQEAIRGLLSRWREDGRTVIVATHDLASATRDYDLVLCLNRRVVAFGPAETTCTEDVLYETFAGRIVRVGSLMVDVSEHHDVH